MSLLTSLDREYIKDCYGKDPRLVDCHILTAEPKSRVEWEEIYIDVAYLRYLKTMDKEDVLKYLYCYENMFGTKEKGRINPKDMPIMTCADTNRMCDMGIIKYETLSLSEIYWEI